MWRKPTTSVSAKPQQGRHTWHSTLPRKLRVCVESFARSMRDKRGCASTTISINGAVPEILQSAVTRGSLVASTSAPTAVESFTATGNENSGEEDEMTQRLQMQSNL